MDQVRGHQKLAAVLNSSNASGRVVSYESQSRAQTSRERAFANDVPKEKGRARRAAAQSQDVARGYEHLRQYVPAHPGMTMGRMTERQAYAESQAAAGRSYYAGMSRGARLDQRHDMESMYGGYYAASVKQESTAASKGKEKRGAAASRRKKPAAAEISTPPPKQHGDISIFPRRKAGQSGIGSNRPPVVVTREVLEENFNMPLLQVCKKLGLCATVLKKVCRQLGVHKWPYKETKLTARRQGKLLGQRQAQGAAAAAATNEAPAVKEEQDEGSAPGQAGPGSVSPEVEKEAGSEGASDGGSVQEAPSVSEEEAAGGASAPKGSPVLASVEAAGGGGGEERMPSAGIGEEETLAEWSEHGGGGGAMLIGEAGQDEFLALAEGGDLQQEEIRWWMCPSEHNGMLADPRGPFASSPPLDNNSLRWADNN